MSVPRPGLGKTKHGGVRLSNLTRRFSIPVIIERDHDTSHLKIGLFNVRSLASKAIIVNELITDHNLDVIGLTETWLKPDEPSSTQWVLSNMSLDLLTVTVILWT